MKQDGLIATLANGTWSDSTAPVSWLNPPAGTNAVDIVNLNAVSCPAAGSCVAVGVYQDTSNNRDGFAETLSGGAWSPAGIPMTGLAPAGLFVNSPFYGPKAGHKLPAPVVGITADPATGGYWLATSAGNVYSFNAPFYGSGAGKSLPGPITGIVADGTGYLLAGRDGSVYNFNTPFYGSEAGKKLPAPVVGITAAG